MPVRPVLSRSIHSLGKGRDGESTRATQCTALPPCRRFYYLLYGGVPPFPSSPWSVARPPVGNLERFFLSARPGRDTKAYIPSVCPPSSTFFFIGGDSRAEAALPAFDSSVCLFVVCLLARLAAFCAAAHHHLTVCVCGRSVLPPTDQESLLVLLALTGRWPLSPLPRDTTELI